MKLDGISVYTKDYWFNVRKSNTEPIIRLKIEATREEKGASLELTETENQIIQFLLIEGPKTAPEVERKIEKTREHTARLMKKLWQEGFIERDTHRIPFVYRVNEKLKERLEAMA
jgi:DNA-binding MarR family transcriptional regulator